MHSQHFAALGLIAVAGIAVAAAAHQLSRGAAPQATAQSDVCTTYTGMPAGFGQAATAGMVRIPAGKIVPGSVQGYADETPGGRSFTVASFWMDRTEVTNAQFAAFVGATGHVTDAEREGGGAVFRRPAPGQLGQGSADWWIWSAGASWKRPEGPASAASAVPNEPVVLVTRADAMAYARWLGRDLPTEGEWEWAARGGGSAELVDREPRDPRGRPVANYWQGLFPDLNTKEDGFAALAPVGCFPANGYGAADMIGNVWELTRDRYTGPHQPHGNGDPGAAVRTADAPVRAREPIVIKGGSFLCAANYCIRYRAAARHPHEADLPTSHVGFRTVLRSTAPAFPGS